MSRLDCGCAGVPRPRCKQRVGDALDLVGLADLADRFPRQLSGGQQQRIAIARSVVLEPRILLFDEPLSNLDFKLRVVMRNELRELQRRLGKTTIYVTHDQSEALALSDRIVVMSNGRIEQIGSPREIYERPANAFVADFIGNSNLLDAVVVGVDADADRHPHRSGPHAARRAGCAQSRRSRRRHDPARACAADHDGRADRRERS